MRATVIVLLSIVSLCILTIGLYRFYSFAEYRGRKDAFRQFAAVAFYTASSESASPQLKEYAKAQLYYYSHFGHHDYSNIPETYYQFGPVKLDLLGEIDAFPPHADSPNDYFKK